MQEIFWPAINEQSDDSRIGWNFDDCWSPFSRPIHFTRGLFLECYSLLTLYASDILLLSLLFPASLGKKDKTRKEKKEKNAREAECRFARRWSPFQFIPCGRRRTIARALSYFIFRIAFGVCALTGKRQVCSPKGSAERTCPTAVCAGQIQTFFFFRLKKVVQLRKLITEPSSDRFGSILPCSCISFIHVYPCMGGKESNYSTSPLISVMSVVELAQRGHMHSREYLTATCT